MNSAGRLSGRCCEGAAAAVAPAALDVGVSMGVSTWLLESSEDKLDCGEPCCLVVLAQASRPRVSWKKCVIRLRGCEM